MSIPAVEGAPELVAVLDFFAANRVRGALPIVLFSGEPGSSRPAEFVTGYRDRLKNEHGLALAPAAHIGDQKNDLDLIDRVVGDLEGSIPPNSGKLRLPNYWACRDVLGAAVAAGPLEVRKREMRDHLFGKHRSRQQSLKWLADLAVAGSQGRLPSLWRAVLEPFVQGLPRWIYGIRLGRARRLRWFNQQVAKAGGGQAANFLQAALQLQRGGPLRSDKELVRRILLTALLQDLAAARRQSHVSVPRRLRNWSFVLHLADASDAAARRFLDTYVGLEHSGSPLMVLAAVGAELPSYVPPPAPNLRTAAERLQGLLDRPIDMPALHSVQIADGLDDPDIRLRLDANSQLAVSSRSVVRAVAHVGMVYLLTASLGAGASVAVAGFTGGGDCAAVFKPAGARELVGITDGSCVLDDRPEGASLRAVEDRIKTENQEVEQSGRPFRTIIYFAPMTTAGLPGHTGNSSLQQVRGAHLAQLAANELAEANEATLPIRLLLANSGDRFKYGDQVADRILEWAADDSTFAAVAGIGQSRVVSKAALTKLDGKSILVIGSAVTGDEMSEGLRHYYQVSTINRRVAAINAGFAARSRIVDIGNGQLSRPEDAVIIASPDPDDLFSSNFGDDFEHEFRKLVKGPDIDPLPYSEQSGTQSLPAQDLAEKVCAATSGRPAVVLYASRAQSLPALLKSLQTAPGCPAKVTMLTSTDVTKLITDGVITPDDLERVRLFTPAHAPAGRPRTTTADVVNQKSTQIGWPVADSDTVLGYDSVRTASMAVNNTYTQHDADFGHEVVATTLHGHGITFSGASGLIALNPAHRFPVDKPIVMLRWDGQASTEVLSCGRWDTNHVDLGAHPWSCPTDQPS